MLTGLLVSVLAQCSFKAEWLRGREVLHLLDGTSFGSVAAPRCSGDQGARVGVDFSSDGGIDLDFHSRGLELQLHASELFVTRNTPTNFGSGFTSSTHTELRVVALNGSRALVEPRERADVRLLGRWTQRLVDCRELKLGSAGRISSSGTEVATETLLSPRPGEAPSFRLPAKTKVSVKSRSRRGSNIVAVLEDGATIDGWVSHPVVDTTMSGSVNVTGQAICCSVMTEGRWCEERLPLFVRRDARVERIGTLDKGTPFHVSSSDGQYLVISSQAQFFALSDGWELVVAQPDLEVCSQVERSR